ncbi:MAG: T9SS type A sorting domain-containing protein [Cytophaga sp.]|uniref:T9SS type A sorting domain-containing protein n=1 Tax=Cytophaga sp. TaxID=29535 RepID=UPI003F800D9A
MRSTSTPQTDTLKLPYVEDFSQAMIPIEKITIENFGTTDHVYQFQHQKLHGLQAGLANPVTVFNVTFPNSPANATTAGYIDSLEGNKFAKVIDKYTIQLFDDTLLTTPSAVYLTGGRLLASWLPYPLPRYSNYPDSLGFLDNNGGVFINDDMSPNPISVGVASFDGVDYNGIPYRTTPVTGFADNLTSLPFNLSTYTTTSNVGFSFYWQSQSLGDAPRTDEYLVVEFKDKNNNWNQVFKQFGGPANGNAFHQEIIPITNPIYLHKGFQYRISNYGILNGRFNVWNVDYIYIDAAMTTSKAQVEDVSFISINKNALQNYTSIPYEHFKLRLNPQMELNPKPRIYIRNSMLKQDAATTFYMQTTDNHLRNLDTSAVAFPLSTALADTIFTPYVDSTLMTQPYILRQNFYFTNVDTITNNTFDPTFNNFRRNETFFYDYYAYDDNTPELALQLKKSGGVRIANEYHILMADDLTHMDICFLKNIGADLSNFTVFMTVWKKDNNGTISEVVAKGQAIPIQYSSSINGFTRYEFYPHISLDTGKYLFGFRQEFSNALYLGYDRNNDRTDQTYTSTDGGKTWISFDSIAYETGALMLRPVFSKGEEIVTPVKSGTEEETRFILYPNPSRQIAHFIGEPDDLIVYDVSGQQLQTKHMSEGNYFLITDNLPNGIYFVALSKDSYTEVKRLIIQK